MMLSEMFGTSEEDVPELDHSEDSENGKTKQITLRLVLTP